MSSSKPPDPTWLEPGLTVGLGTGSTVAHLLPALAGRGLVRALGLESSWGTEKR